MRAAKLMISICDPHKRLKLSVFFYHYAVIFFLGNFMFFFKFLYIGMMHKWFKVIKIHFSRKKLVPKYFSSSYNFLFSSDHLNLSLLYRQSINSLDIRMDI